MGLFDSFKQKSVEKKERIQAAENELMRSFSQSPLLDAFIRALLDATKEAQWLIEGDALNDTCRRYVRFDRDRIQISQLHIHTEWVRFGSGDSAKEREQFVEDIIKEQILSYSDQGYSSLGEYQSRTICDPKKGTPIVVSQFRVVELWAQVVREHMQAKMPGCTFGEVTPIKHVSILDVDFGLGIKTLPADCDFWIQFTYDVPKKVSKGWF